MSIEYGSDERKEYVEGQTVHLALPNLREGWMDQFNSPSSAITTEFRETLTGALADQVISPDVFDAETVIERLHDRVHQTAPGVIQRRLETEKDARGIFDQLKDQQITRFLEDVPDTSQMILDEESIESIHGQLDGDDYQKSLRTLQEMHGKWPSKVFACCQAIEVLDSSDIDNKHDMMLEIVEEMATQPEEYTLPASETPAAFLLTHFPGRSRQLTRRMLAGLHIAAVLDAELPDRTDHENAMLANIRKAYILDTLHGQQWEGLALSEDARKKVLDHSANHTRTLAQLQRSGDSEEGRRLKEIYWEIVTSLEEKIWNGRGDYALEHLQTVDIGHAFSDIAPSWGMLKAFRQGMYNAEQGGVNFDFTAEKCGLKSLILEDDQRQRAMTAEMIDAYSPLSVDDGLVFASPEGIDEAVIDREDIGWFVLDIQNGEDLTAGVRVAEAVLRRRLNLEYSKTFITVHSASQEAIQDAARYFEDIIEKEKLDCGYDLSGSMRASKRVPVFIEVKSKDWGLSGIGEVGRYFSR